jgi:hypothetical protein
MILTQLKSGDLKHIMRLLERKEGLLDQIKDIDRQLAAFESVEPDTAAPAAPAASKAKTASGAPKKRRLSAEGRARISAAAKARWANEKKTAPKKTAPKKAVSKKAAAKKTSAKSAKSGGGTRRKRGALKEQIIGFVKSAGKSGITVKEIAAKLGGKPDRIHVWFNATGKNVKQIKRIRPATYAWQE